METTNIAPSLIETARIYAYVLGSWSKTRPLSSWNNPTEEDIRAITKAYARWESVTDAFEQNLGIEPSDAQKTKWAKLVLKAEGLKG